MAKTKKNKSAGNTLSAKQYQAQTHQFAAFPVNLAMEYLAMGFASEAGEVAGKASKLIRGDYVEVAEELDAEGKQQMRINIDAFHNDLWREMGDCAWFLSELCNLTGTTLEHLFAQNIKKLQARATNDSIKGSGDSR